MDTLFYYGAKVFMTIFKLKEWLYHLFEFLVLFEMILYFWQEKACLFESSLVLKVWIFKFDSKKSDFWPCIYIIFYVTLKSF